MAIETTDYSIQPADGWVEVGTAPTFCHIKPSHRLAYYVCISDAGAPTVANRGMLYDDGFPFVYQVAAEGGEIYIRVPEGVRATTEELHFAVATDGTPA